MKELQSLASKLSWAAQVMPPVRAFFHSLFAVAHGDPQYHLPSSLRQDIELIFKMLSSASQIPVSPRVSVPTLCRVDAMASTNQCFIVGWFVCLSWLQGKPLTASWLFENAELFLILRIQDLTRLHGTLQMLTKFFPEIRRRSMLARRKL